MIRINLLPVKAAKRRASGLRQVLIGATAIVATLAAVAFVHLVAEGAVSAQKAEIDRLNASIKGLKAQVGDYEQVKAQRESLLRQKAAIKKLQDQRSGPAFLLRELSDILTTKGKGPTLVHEQYDQLIQQDPTAGFNAGWEPKRCWLISYAEKDGVATIKGGAKSAEDVAEFLKRLKLSAFFSEVYWRQTQPQVDPRLNNVAYVTFDVTARVHY